MTASRFLDDILIRANRGMGKTSVGGGAKPRGERVWKSLTSTGSAFVKRIPGAGVQHPKQLAGQLAYVNGKAKGTFGFATGIDAGGDSFEQADLDQMMSGWARDWEGRPRNGHTSHMVLSFPDDVSQNAAFMIAQEWCAEMFEDETHVSDSWEYVAALHTDTANPHVHIVLNNRGLGGTWFSISSEGVFNPQMMRDRMTDIADDYGIRLESLSRADRGLYRDPITSAGVHAAREGRTLSTEDVKANITADWRREDMQRTAELYVTLAGFAKTIGAPMIAKRAYISAAALFAGDAVPKGQMMEIDLDINADREDIRTSLIGWTDQNKEQIEALPERERTEIMAKIDLALNIIETDVTPDLTEDLIWAAFKKTPSSYLIPNVGALEARAALYVDEDKAVLMHEFVNENVLDTYLVTGEVPSRFTAVMPAVAEAYEEMHSHRLEEIPKKMKDYVQKAASMGIDPVQMQERLINAIDDPIENMKIEREDIASIVATAKAKPKDTKAFEDASSRIMEAATASVEHGISSPLDRFEPMQVSWSKALNADNSADRQIAWDELAGDLTDLADAKDRGDLTAEQESAFNAVAPVIYARHATQMTSAISWAADFNMPLTEDDRQIMTPEVTPQAHEAAMRHQASERIERLKDAFETSRTEPEKFIAAYRKAEADYHDLQLALGDVEEKIIADSKVYSRDGVARVLQDAASTAATTGRADLADSAAGRSVLIAFVALEGRGAMQEISTGNMDALSEYVDTPAHQRLAAKELLKSAKSVDVGLEPSEIEAGLEAVDPNYSRGRGYSI